MIRRLAAVLLVVAAAGVVGWRVFRPTDVLASGTMPPAVASAPGVTGRTALPPLLVDGRLRVFASKRAIRADGPVTLPTMYTPTWSFRRWPAQVSGVVAAGTTIVSRWSDGELVAIDGLTGRLLWRAAGPSGGGFTDSRTAVWSPPGLFATTDTVLLRQHGRVRAYAASTGAVLWERDCPGAECGGVTLRPAGSFGPVTGPFELTAGRHLVIRSIDVPLKTAKETSLDWEPGGWQLADGYLAIERLKPDGTPFAQERVIIVALGA